MQLVPQLSPLLPRSTALMLGSWPAWRQARAEQGMQLVPRPHLMLPFLACHWLLTPSMVVPMCRVGGNHAILTSLQPLKSPSLLLLLRLAFAANSPANTLAAGPRCLSCIAAQRVAGSRVSQLCLLVLLPLGCILWWRRTSVSTLCSRCLSPWMWTGLLWQLQAASARQPLTPPCCPPISSDTN